MVDQNCVFIVRNGIPVIECLDAAAQVEAYEAMVAHPDVQVRVVPFIEEDTDLEVDDEDELEGGVVKDGDDFEVEDDSDEEDGE